VATTAIRDEETSLHYLAPGKEVDCPAPIPSLLARELPATGWPVRSGTVWTTDAPNRETTTQLQQWAHYGVLALEMQAASLFALGQARGVAVGCVAMVSNAVDYEDEQFDTGSQEDSLRILACCARAFRNDPPRRQASEPKTNPAVDYAPVEGSPGVDGPPSIGTAARAHQRIPAGLTDICKVLEIQEEP
jgi:hypothetical protein